MRWCQRGATAPCEVCRWRRSWSRWSPSSASPVWGWRSTRPKPPSSSLNWTNRGWATRLFLHFIYGLVWIWQLSITTWADEKHRCLECCSDSVIKSTVCEKEISCWCKVHRAEVSESRAGCGVVECVTMKALMFTHVIFLFNGGRSARLRCFFPAVLLFCMCRCLKH